MLRPNWDEGERPKHHNSIRKAPLLLATALLVGYPLCLGQAALASTSSSFGLDQQRYQPQTTLGTLKQTQPKSYQGQRLLSSTSLPSESEISSLETILSGYQSRLASLRTQATNRPDLSETLAPLISGLEREISSLASDISNAKAARQTYANAISTLTKATDTYNKVSSAVQQATSALDSAKSILEAKTSAHAEATSARATAATKLTQAQAALASATTARQLAQDELADATTSHQEAQDAFAEADSEYNSALAAYNSLVSTEQQATSTYLTAQLQLTQAQQALSDAQAAYDSSQVPNPNYVPPSYTTQPTTYQIPDNNFMTGAPWIGDGSGQNGAPEAHPGHLHFSYIGTEVYQDVLISPRQIANYAFTVGIWNQDQNSVGRGAVADTYSLRIYFYDASNNLIHQNSITSSEVHSWRDITLQGNTNTTTEVARVRIGIYGIDNGFWAGTYGPAANNVRLMLGWITGSTQGSTTTGTMQVSINEGGESTYTAPNGGVFVSSNLRYEAIDDPTCGTNVTPNNLGSNTITLAADNGIWGDPCGGWYKRLVGTLTYSASEPQFIKDPALLLVVQAAQATLTQAQTSKENAESSLEDTQTSLSGIIIDLDLATSYREDAVLDLADASADLSEAQTLATAALVAETTATANQTTASLELATIESSLALAQTELSTAQADLASKETAASTASLQLASALEEKTSAETTLSSTQTRYQAVISSASQVKPDFARVEEELAKPEPKPEPEEEGSKEIPAELSAENLMSVNLEKVDPTELTPAQAEQLKEAALETFETAEKGSAEYQQALEALFVAAQQDDLTLPEELAAIPGLAAAVEVLNFLGNAGADMSPQVREESEKVVVAAVVAAGAAIQGAAAAASAASASAGSSGSRR